MERLLGRTRSRVAWGMAKPRVPSHLLQAIGTIFMRADLRELRSQLALFAAISPLILLVAFAVGYLIIRRLQRTVSVPLVTLAETSRRISTEGDYSLRAPQLGNDELGQLAVNPVNVAAAALTVRVVVAVLLTPLSL